MTIYNFTNSVDFEFNVNANYVYDFYKVDERVQNDNVIKNNSNDPFSFINLEVQYNNKYDDRIFNYFSYLRGNLQEIFSLSSSQDGVLHELSSSELNLFNKLDSIEDNLILINSDIFLEEVEKTNNYYQITSNQHQNAINFITSNKKLQINREVKNNFLESNKNNFLFSKNISNSLESFESLFRKEETLFKNDNSVKIADNFIPFKTTSIHNYTDVSEDLYYCCIGVLVEKYIIDNSEEENLFLKKDTKFFASTRFSAETSQEATYFNNFTINDTAVKYGSEYFYAIYPVYAMTLPKKNDYFLVETYLVCDYPYFTKKVICKESKRPESPNNLSFKYLSKDKKLRINWSKPLEKQGDVKGYQVFKRKNLNKAYSIIKQIEFFKENDFYERNPLLSNSVIEKVNFNKTTCIDEDFNINEVQIYTVCSLDARGYSSNYSEQIAVYYDFYTKDLIVDLVSNDGAPLHMPNLLIGRKTKFFDNEEKIINNTPYEENVRKISLYLTPEYKEINIDDSPSMTQLLSEKYKFSIFKLENNQQIIKDINIKLE